MTVAEFPAGDGGQVYVQLTGNAGGDGETGLSRAGTGDRAVQLATHTWEQSLECMQAAAEGAVNQLRRIDPVPDEIKVTFGVNVNGKLGAAVVTAGADAHLNVEVTWKKPADEPSE